MDEEDNISFRHVVLTPGGLLTNYSIKINWSDKNVAKELKITKKLIVFFYKCVLWYFETSYSCL